MPTDAAPISPLAENAPLVVEQSDNLVRVAPPGRKFDGLAVRALFETAMQLISRRDLRLLVDLTGVDLVTSGAMGMFVTIRKKFLSTGGQLHIAVPDPQVMQQFELLNLQRVLHLFPNVDDALARFK
jgi:anti-anti-sigma factor